MLVPDKTFVVVRRFATLFLLSSFYSESGFSERDQCTGCGFLDLRDVRRSFEYAKDLSTSKENTVLKIVLRVLRTK